MLYILQRTALRTVHGCMNTAHTVQERRLEQLKHVAKFAAGIGMPLSPLATQQESMIHMSTRAPDYCIPAEPEASAPGPPSRAVPGKPRMARTSPSATKQQGRNEALTGGANTPALAVQGAGLSTRWAWGRVPHGIKRQAEEPMLGPIIGLLLA